MTSFNSRNKKLARAGITVAAVLCTYLFTYGASAEQPQTVSVTVSYADLDLSKAAGAQTLYKRIKAAARRACGSIDGYTHMKSQRGWRECYETTMADAVGKVNLPVLTALHQQQSSKTARS
jgi:UrcA family protein